MSNWTHNICILCYQKLYPGRTPVLVDNDEVERCCFCGYMNTSGIYVRRDPKEMNCVHED